MNNLVERLGAAGHDERLATGILYLEAAAALRAANLGKWRDLPSLIRERIVDALIPTIDDNGCYDPQEIYEVIRHMLNGELHSGR